MAERAGFEPADPLLRSHLISNQAPSASRPPLRARGRQGSGGPGNRQGKEYREAMHVHLARGAVALLALVQARAAPDVLPGDPLAALGEELRRSLARLDPREAGWTSEQRAAAASAQLERLARFLETPGADPELELAGLFAPDFGARFAFAQLEDVYASEAFRVRRRGPALREVEDGGRDAFLTGLLEPLRGAREIRAELLLTSFEEKPEGPETKALLVLAAV